MSKCDIEWFVAKLRLSRVSNITARGRQLSVKLCKGATDTHTPVPFAPIQNDYLYFTRRIRLYPIL